LASGDRTGEVKVWDASGAGQRPALLGKHDGEIAHLEFSRTGDRLVSAGEGLINVWPIGAVNRNPVAYRGHDGTVYFANFSKDSRLLISGGFDRTVRIWAGEQELGAPVELPSHPGSVESIAFSPTKALLATDDSVSRRRVSSEVRLWNLERLESAPALVKGHEQGIVAVRFTADGQRIITGGTDGQVILWSAAPPYAQKAVFKHPSRVTSLAVTSDSRVLAVGCTVSENRDANGVVSWSRNSTGKVYLRDLTSGGGRMIAELGFYGHCIAVDVSCDNRWLAVGREGWQDENISILLYSLKDSGGKPVEFKTGLRGPVRGLAFSPDGKWLACGSAWLDHRSRKITDGRIILWEMSAFDGQSASMPRVLDAGEGAVAALHFSPKEDLLVAGSENGAVQLWDLRRSTAKPALLRRHHAAVRSVAFAPDGRRIVSGDEGGKLVFWHATSDLLEMTSAWVSRNLSMEEWQQFVGADLPYEKTCSHLPVHPTVIEAITKEVKAAGLASALAVIAPNLQMEVKPGVAKRLREEIRKELDSWKSPNIRNTADDHEKQCDPDTYRSRLSLALELDPDLKFDVAQEPNRLCAESLLERGRSLIYSSAENTISEGLKLIRRAQNLLPSSTALSPEKQVAGHLLDFALREAKGSEFSSVTRNVFADVTKRIHEAAGLDPDIDESAQLRAAKQLRVEANARDAVFWLNRMTINSAEIAARDLESAFQLLDATPAASAKDEKWPSLLILANRMAKEGKLDEAVHAFSRAKADTDQIQFDAKKTGRLAVAMHRLNRAKQEIVKGEVDRAIEDFRSIEKEFPEICLHQVHWNHLCWFGCLVGRAKDVLFAGERAVELERKGYQEPYVDHGLRIHDYRDTRGLAYALTGNFQGAIDDFQSYVDNTKDSQSRSQRAGWIESLKTGKQAFSSKLLGELLRNSLSARKDE